MVDLNTPSRATVREATGNAAAVRDLNKPVNGTGIADKSAKRRIGYEDRRNRGTVLAERAFVGDISGDGKVSSGDALNRGSGWIVETGWPGDITCGVGWISAAADHQRCHGSRGQ